MIARFGPPGPPSTAEVEPLTPEQVARWVPDPEDRRVLAHLVVALELMVHPLPRELESHVEQYLGAIGVEAPYVSITRDTAREHLRRLHADLIRNSWYTEQTIEGIFHGHLGELVRSKLSYYAIGDDEHIARRWRALEDCPEGSWGHGVAEFYRVHEFPYPGEHHGIYEVGALHDWVHVLADYATDAEGEIDVFAFIAATMDDPRGFVQFIFTLALFQNAVDRHRRRHPHPHRPRRHPRRGRRCGPARRVLVAGLALQRGRHGRRRPLRARRHPPRRAARTLGHRRARAARTRRAGRDRAPVGAHRPDRAPAHALRTGRRRSAQARRCPGVKDTGMRS